jgi:DNA-binding response OmpR family regulator
MAPRGRALIIEDSITARVFLARMLEARGFEARSVASAEEALRELGRGEWTLLCVDLELPDARGADWLRSLLERVPADTPVIALVRDRQDRETARAAGVSRALRKPFDEFEVSALIERLGGRVRSDA